MFSPCDPVKLMTVRQEPMWRRNKGGPQARSKNTTRSRNHAGKGARYTVDDRKQLEQAKRMVQMHDTAYGGVVQTCVKHTHQARECRVR